MPRRRWQSRPWLPWGRSTTPPRAKPPDAEDGEGGEDEGTARATGDELEGAADLLGSLPGIREGLTLDEGSSSSSKPSSGKSPRGSRKLSVETGSPRGSRKLSVEAQGGSRKSIDSPRGSRKLSVESPRVSRKSIESPRASRKASLESNSGPPSRKGR